MAYSPPPAKRVTGWDSAQMSPEMALRITPMKPREVSPLPGQTPGTETVLSDQDESDGIDHCSLLPFDQRHSTTPLKAVNFQDFFPPSLGYDGRSSELEESLCRIFPDSDIFSTTKSSKKSKPNCSKALSFDRDVDMSPMRHTQPATSSELGSPAGLFSYKETLPFVLKSYDSNTDNDTTPVQQARLSPSRTKQYARAKLSKSKLNKPSKAKRKLVIGENDLTMDKKIARKAKCSCKKVKCLKLYCECFAALVLCSDCNCSNCFNTAEHEDARQQAIASIKSRNPNAFTSKISTKNGKHKKGCHCKKSSCMKKYCECFQAGIMCGGSCKCKNCQNFDPAVKKNADAQQGQVSQNGGLTSMCNGQSASTNNTDSQHAQTKSLTSKTASSHSSQTKNRRVYRYKIFGERNVKFSKHIINKIFGLLTDEDLYRACTSSKLWLRRTLDKDLWVSSHSLEPPVNNVLKKEAKKYQGKN